MIATRSTRSLLARSGTILTALLWIAATPGVGSAQVKPTATKTFAQALVDATHAAHPEIDEIGISAMTSHGCVGIASTDKSDVGEKCEADDVTPMKTGKPSVGKEGTGYDVSVPLHDVAGKTVGVLGVGFKAAPGQTAATVTQTAQKIAAEMAAKIPSKAKLFARANQ
ncbi:MAG: hypothetical protein ACREL5_12860 [Gemmatimonadales bacterium]